MHSFLQTHIGAFMLLHDTSVKSCRLQAGIRKNEREAPYNTSPTRVPRITLPCAYLLIPNTSWRNKRALTTSFKSLWIEMRMLRLRNEASLHRLTEYLSGWEKVGKSLFQLVSSFYYTLFIFHDRVIKTKWLAYIVHWKQSRQKWIVWWNSSLQFQ